MADDQHTMLESESSYSDAHANHERKQDFVKPKRDQIESGRRGGARWFEGR